jgi:hypothetical protein
MTTLILFNSERSQPDDFVKANLDWGTGQRHTRSSSDPDAVHPPGTYLYT